jgi:DNA gyrase subunit B
VNDYARKNGLLKEKEENLSGEDTREGLTAIILVKLPDPQFEGQTKNKLGNPEMRGYVESVFAEWFGYYLEEASGELNKLEASKDPKYAEYVVSARNFVNANLDMYKNLNSLLVGKLPTREDVALLNASLQNVRQQSEIYESAALNVVK